jgi:hypothetical protein
VGRIASSTGRTLRPSRPDSRVGWGANILGLLARRLQRTNTPRAQWPSLRWLPQPPSLVLFPGCGRAHEVVADEQQFRAITGPDNRARVHRAAECRSTATNRAGNNQHGRAPPTSLTLRSSSSRRRRDWHPSRHDYQVSKVVGSSQSMRLYGPLQSACSLQLWGKKSIGGRQPRRQSG